MRLYFIFDVTKIQALPLLTLKRRLILLTMHHLLLNKLGAIGLGEDYLLLSADYLSGRKQNVNIDGFRIHSTILLGKSR